MVLPDTFNDDNKVVLLDNVLKPETFNDDINVELLFNVVTPETFNDIGGQTCVNLCKPGKLFWGPKRDLAGSCQQSAGRNKHIALRAGAKGF